MIVKILASMKVDDLKTLSDVPRRLVLGMTNLELAITARRRIRDYYLNLAAQTTRRAKRATVQSRRRLKTAQEAHAEINHETSDETISELDTRLAQAEHAVRRAKNLMKSRRLSPLLPTPLKALSRIYARSP